MSTIDFNDLIIPATPLPEDETERCISIGNRSRSWISEETQINNMATWFPEIEKNSSMKYPKTQIIHLNDEWLGWLSSDSYSDERKTMFQSYIMNQIDPYFFDKELFVRTGTFSDKFRFDAGPHVTNIDQIGKHILEVFYSCMCVGAGTTDTVVIREYLPAPNNTPTIYQGMPLRREIRFFVDFDKGNILGYADYWHPKAMAQIPILNGVEVKVPRELLESVSEEGIGEIKKLQENYPKSSSYMKETWKDWLTYAEWFRCQDPINAYVDAVKDDILSFAKKGQLQGAWSVDVMFNSLEDYYLIDMAMMKHSALTEYMEKIEL